MVNSFKLLAKLVLNLDFIPLVLKLKTNEIGYFTYYGEFGATLGLKTKSTVDDDSKLFTWNSSDSTFIESQPFTTTLENINISREENSILMCMARSQIYE